MFLFQMDRDIVDIIGLSRSPTPNALKGLLDRIWLDEKKLLEEMLAA